MTFTQMGLRLGDIKESGETGDSREEEDTQWRQVITSEFHLGGGGAFAPP